MCSFMAEQASLYIKLSQSALSLGLLGYINTTVWCAVNLHFVLH